MKGNGRVIEALNDLLTLELTVINQYFLHSKMCENWGYRRLAKRFRDVAFEEMKDAERIIDRILFLEGVPNMQRLGAVTIGESVPEQLQIQLEGEGQALRVLADGIKVSLEEGDDASRIAVGTALAGGPPHRSQRALLTHWAPALSAGGESRVRPGMQHAGGWEPTGDQALHARPGEPMALAVAPQRPIPVPDRLGAEGLHGVRVAGHGVVGEVTSHHAGQPASLLGDRQVPASHERELDLAQLRRHPP
jgi:bacterioferritin